MKFTYFALSQDKQKTSKLKTQLQLMFTVKNVKNLVLIKFISLWDTSFDFFPTISTHNYLEPQVTLVLIIRDLEILRVQAPKTKGQMGTPGKQSAQPTNWATNWMPRSHEITLLRGGPKNQLKRKVIITPFI